MNKEYVSLRKGIKEFLLPNQSLLSRCSNSKNELLKLPYSLFSDYIVFYTRKSFDLPDLCNTTMLLDDGESTTLKIEILKLLHSADMQIEDIKIEHDKNNGVINYLKNNKKNEDEEKLIQALSAAPKLAHKMLTESSEIKYEYFDLEKQESSGTSKLYDLSSYILSSLVHGKTFIIDEFNNALHPIIEKMIIELYLNPNVNKKNAQLLITSHDTYILDACKLKREQVWFTDKNNNGETELYCLNEFDKNLIRDYATYGKYYLDGRFRALPAVTTPQF